MSQSPLLGVTVRPKLTVTVDTNVNSTVLTLEDNVQSWRPGDTLVVASTDYSMYQAEEFQVLPCRACASNQVRVAGRTSRSPPPAPVGWRNPDLVRLKGGRNHRQAVLVSYRLSNAA